MEFSRFTRIENEPGKPVRLGEFQVFATLKSQIGFVPDARQTIGRQPMTEELFLLQPLPRNFSLSFNLDEDGQGFKAATQYSVRFFSSRHWNPLAGMLSVRKIFTPNEMHHFVIQTGTGTGRWHEIGVYLDTTYGPPTFYILRHSFREDIPLF